MVAVFGNEVAVEVGSVIRFDGNPIARGVLAGYEAVDDSFRGSDFAIESIHYPNGVPANVTITGRTAQRHGGELWVRVLVEFVQDGEASHYQKGWLLVR